MAIIPLFGGVGPVEAVADTNLASLDGDIGVTTHVTILGTAVDGAFHQGGATNSDVGSAHKVKVGYQSQLGVLLFCGKVIKVSGVEAAATAVDMALVGRHLQCHRAHLTSGNLDGGDTCIRGEGTGDTDGTREATHRSQSAATIDVSVDAEVVATCWRHHHLGVGSGDATGVEVGLAAITTSENVIFYTAVDKVDDR